MKYYLYHKRFKNREILNQFQDWWNFKDFKKKEKKIFSNTSKLRKYLI